ncbi:tripartite tricarboxylate transporter TctB family protein [Microvirga antarctica]|uniref:tripartite tricarboxylate transporter TctB family protein n=1 Tax=Microvirga antarctica TaxID=2819233 RepID=UPI001FE90094|nr:tripartite tricarboxylate transporter TctB family protein [Microvirga antarctica]
MTRRIDVAGLVIALILLAVAGLIWLDMSSLELSSVYGMGPKAAPKIVALGLGILAIGNAIMALRGDLPARESLDWKPIVLIIGGMAALIALIKFGGGFILATTVLFVATSAAFGRRALLADIAIGVVISIVIYILFSKLLTLSLPVGPLERLI